eukprot:3941018-Rhodomonas_salina.2
MRKPSLENLKKERSGLKLAAYARLVPVLLVHDVKGASSLRSSYALSAKIDEMLAGDFKFSIPCLAVSRAVEAYGPGTKVVVWGDQGQYYIAVGSYGGSIKLWQLSVESYHCYALPSLEGVLPSPISLCAQY